MRYKERFKSHHDAARELKRYFTASVDKSEYLAELLRRPARRPRVIYLHVPFCNKICSFCPFHRPDALKRREYDKYLINDIKKIADYEYMRAPVNAVYFGGGTPTALSPKQMERVLKELKSNFSIASGAEISVETSVTELTDEMLHALKENGVNRLSVGVQTFDDNTRKLLNRRGSGEAAVETLKRALATGITNVGVDLIYNYPRQTVTELQRDLDIVKSLNLAGVSMYSLMLHERTPLAKKITEPERAAMRDIWRDAEFFYLIADELSSRGFEFFELTKMIRSGLDRYEYMRVRHGGGSCIALGRGAGGNLDNYLYSNSDDSEDIGGGIRISAKGKMVTDDYIIIDEFVNELQKTKVDLAAYSERLHINLNALLETVTDELQRENLIVKQNNEIKLTRSGLFFGNNIISEFAGLIIGARKKDMEEAC